MRNSFRRTRQPIHIDAQLQARIEQLDDARIHERTLAVESDAQDTETAPQRATEILARIAWSRLAEPGDGTAGMLLETIGPIRALELLIDHVSATQLRSIAAEAGLELGQEISRALQRWYPRLNHSETLEDIEHALAAGMTVLLPGDPGWPSALADLGEHQPTMLWVKGDSRHLTQPSLSVVGARAVTGYGAHVTAEIVEGVCASGVVIVSGAAYGVDAVAHRTALAVETPTIAVLAGGADRAYPASHDTLLERIAASGAVCSEMVPGAAPTRWRFLQRNRIIAALSGATLVTEAGLRSGTINTAGHAASLGRALGAVPGPTTSATSAGCHRLIREYGATLVTNAREVCELIGVADPLELESIDTGRELSLHRRILDALPLRGSRATVDAARLAGVTVEEARGAFAELELLGHVSRQDSPNAEGQKWRLSRSE